MKKFLSILAGSIVTVLIATSFTPATAGMNWNDVWGALKNGGVKQPTPEPRTYPQVDSSSATPSNADVGLSTNSDSSNGGSSSSATPSNADAGLSTNDDNNTDSIPLG